MAISNLFKPPSFSSTISSLPNSTPAVNKGTGLLPTLGIGGNSKLGGGSLFPSPAASATPASTPLMSGPELASYASNNTPVKGLLTPPAQSYAAAPSPTGNVSTSSTVPSGGSTAAPVAPPPTYSGLVGTLAGGQQNSQNAQNAQTSIHGLQGTAATNPGTSGQAYQDYQTKVNDLQKLKSGIAAQQGGIESQAIPLQFQQGREQALNRQYASQVDAAQQAVNQAQQGVGFQIAGTQAQQTGLNQAGGLALQGQGQSLGALNQAAGYAQPQLGGIGQVPFNPLDQGQGQVLGSGQQGGVAAAGNLLGRLQGAQAAGAAPGQTQANILSTQGQQIAGYQSALQQGQNLQAQLGDLISQAGLNPNDINAANTGIQYIASHTSDPRYKILQNYVNDIANTYSQVLTPPGGSATDTSRGIATSMLDATAKGQSILTVMKSLDEAAKAKIAGVSTTGNGSQAQGNGGSGSGFAETW